jgi:outer membrane cobalamin receptor
MKNYAVAFWGFIVMLNLSNPSFAGDTHGIENDTIINGHLNELVITANRFRDINFKVPQPVYTIQQTTISQNQLRSTPEALTILPGVFVQKTNHGGGSPFLRGLTGNQTLMLIDGIRMSNSTMRYGPNQYLNSIDVFGIDRVEVLNGSGSVQYGSDALGGTIQLFTTDANYDSLSTWHGKLLGRVTTQSMEQSGHFRLAYGSKKFAFTGGISYRKFGDLVAGKNTGIQDPTGYKELDFDLKAKVKLLKATELVAAFQQVHQTEVPVYHKISLENYAINQMDPQSRNLGYLKINQGLSQGIWKSAHFTASTQYNMEVRKLKKNGATKFREEKDQVNTLGFSLDIITGSKAGHGWNAVSGVEYYRDLVNSSRSDLDEITGITTHGRGLYPDGSRYASWALFSNHSYDWKRWNITAGGRFSGNTIQVTDENLGDVELAPSALVGNIAIMRQLGPASNVFVSVNTGYRAPNIDDLGTLGIVDFRYEVPNYNLEPEKSVQYQVGYKLQLSRFTGELYLYQNNLNNLIVRSKVEGDSIEGYPVYRKENVESALIRGLETNFEYRLHKNWLLEGSLTYTYGQNLTKNEPVRRIPPLFGRLMAEYRKKDFRVSLESLFADKQDRLAAGDKDDNRIPEGGTPGWVVFNIHAGYSWKILSVNVALNNLLNADYRYHGSGVNAMGRSATLTLAVSI